MKLEYHLYLCSSLLEKWTDFLQLEPVRKYPNFCPEQIKPWIKELSNKSIEEVIELENNYSVETEFSEFSRLLSQIKYLITFDKIKSDQNKHLISNKIKKKKEHEIKQIKYMLDKLDDFYFLDIGGGSGHLSENLVQEKSRIGYCIDSNAELKTSGLKRIEKNNPENINKIKFHTLNFSNSNFKIPSNEYDRGVVLSLHACGDLTSDVLKYFNKSKAEHLVSIGCCYHKLSLEHNLSKEARLQFSTNALNLAARSNYLSSVKNLELKLKIRKYRYMLHCYLSYLGLNEYVAIGRTKTSDYEKSFGEYASIYAKDLIESRQDAQNFFNESKNQNIVTEIVYTDIFRGLFGRLIETYVVLDRALFLKERGYDVKIKEVFDKSLSPRNLAIVV